MQVIPAVICRQETFRMLRIAEYAIKIDHGVEVPGERIQRFTACLSASLRGPG